MCMLEGTIAAFKELYLGNHTVKHTICKTEMSSVLNNLRSAFMHCLYKALEPTTVPGLDLYMEAHYLI